jgi:PIN domain nuclease of toxin-antitoxin system
LKILLDTHVFLWTLSEPEKLRPTVRSSIELPSNQVFVSAMTVAEIVIKESIGKLDVRFDPLEMIDKLGFERLDFSVLAARRLGTLPLHHRDPFDRMLIAQAIEHDLSIASYDPVFVRYDCKLLE